MPAFGHLGTQGAAAIIAYLSKPAAFRWTEQDINASRATIEGKPRDLGIHDIRNITPVVERGGNKVWIMEDDRILDKFPVNNVHGGIKYTLPGGERIFIPSRDGWVTQYSLKEGRLLNKVRACVYLRNISVSQDNKRLFATCRLPQNMVVFNASTLEIEKIQPLDGRISALYDLYTRDEALFTYRDKPQLGILDTKTLEIEYIQLDEPFEDFFIDPFENFVIGTSRRGKRLEVFDLKTRKSVFSHPIDSMPHLFSATYWYQDGHFYFATPHLRQNSITVWQMYDWSFVKKVDVGGDGFFVKTHPATPWLWVDNGSDQLVLVNKKDYKTKTLVPIKGKKFNHTEFSGDGRYAYLSIYEPDGALLVYDTATLKPLKHYPANVPVGKYNYINKNRRFYPALFGQTLFEEKCWGCHHQTAEAFGPPFAKIAATRTDAQIMAHISTPEASSKTLGYSRNLMPAFDLTQEQLLSITAFIKETKQ
jgi:mono/diheme cytochrome c family protein